MPTITGQIKGTVAYMSPEQAAGRSDLVDVRTDVYSLGVILYQMCTGKLPYDVLGTILEALKNIQYTEPARPRQTISRFDSDVEAIILKCLAKDPDQRYQSAGELKQDVQRWLDGLPIVAKSVSSIYLLRKIVARHRYTATVITSLLMILGSSASVSFYMYGEARNACQEKERDRQRALKREQEQRAVAQAVTEGSARLVADLMMRNRAPVGDPSTFFELYGPRHQIKGASAADRTVSPARPPQEGGESPKPR